jgi:hypothetical protein
LLLIFPQTFTGDTFLNVRHFSGGEAIAEDEHSPWNSLSVPRREHKAEHNSSRMRARLPANVDRLFRAILPDFAANEFSPARKLFAVLAQKIRSLAPEADIDEIVEQVEDPGTLVQVAEKNDKLKLPAFASSVLNFVSWREQAQSLAGLAGVGFSSYTLSGSGEPEQFSGNTISPALIRVLGIPPLAGRGGILSDGSLRHGSGDTFGLPPLDSHAARPRAAPAARDEHGRSDRFAKER